MDGLPSFNFAPVEPGPKSFVLANQLAYCRFSFYTHPAPAHPPTWRPTWGISGWPAGIRVEMGPLETDPSRVQPISIVVPIRLHRAPDIDYVDY